MTIKYEGNRFRKVTSGKQEGLEEQKYQQSAWILPIWITRLCSVQSSKIRFLLQQLSSSEVLDEQDKKNTWRETKLVGEEAAQRLEALDQQKSELKIR